MENKKISLIARVAAIVALLGLGVALPILHSVEMRFGTPSIILATASSLVLLIAIIIERKSIATFFSLRAVRKAIAAALSTIVVASILVVAYIISVNFSWRFDTTERKTFSLSSQTRNLLDELHREIEVAVFRQEEENTASFRWQTDALLKEYQKLNKNIIVRYIDPVRERKTAREYQVKEVGEIVITYSGENKGERAANILESDLTKKPSRDETVFVGEEKITSAIYSLVETDKTTIYFTLGHGEKDLRDTENEGISFLFGFLEAENYSVLGIDTIKAKSVPTNASMLVIAGPTLPFTESEISLLDSYLDLGGRIMVLYDSVTEIQGGYLPRFEAFLTRRGFKLEKSYILDRLSSVETYFNVLPVYTSHPITKPLQENQVYTCFVMPRSVREGKTKGSWVISDILETSDQSWAETDLSVEWYNAGYDKNESAGPLTIAMLATYSESENGKEGKMLLVGDSDFLANQRMFGSDGRLVFIGNRDFFLNAAAYLTDTEKKITIRPKPASRPRLMLTKGQSAIIIALVLVIIPLIFAVCGVLVWLNRRS